MVHSPNDALQSHQVSGRNSPRGRVGGQKGLKNPESPEKLSPARGGGKSGGRPLWDMSTYLHQHRRDITQTCMVDSPSDALKTPQSFASKLAKGQGQWTKKASKSAKGHEIMSERGPGTSVSEDQGRARPCNHITTEP